MEYRDSKVTLISCLYKIIATQMSQTTEKRLLFDANSGQDKIAPKVVQPVSEQESNESRRWIFSQPTSPDS